MDNASKLKLSMEDNIKSANDVNSLNESREPSEHGCGFAVVSDEVHKLAERTQKATS